MRAVVATLAALGLLASQSVPAAAVPAQIPFRLEGHNIVVEMELKPKLRLPFAFDSGLSSGNLITTAAAHSLGIGAQTEMGVRDAAGQRSAAQLTTLPVVRIGPVALSDVPFAITAIPAEVLRRPGGGALAGFVGAPLLKDAVLCVDYRHHQLLRWNNGDFDAAGMAAIPMKLNHGLPTVSIDIDGRPATLIVDTGATSALTVYASFAEANDFSHRYKPLDMRSGNGGNGSHFQSVITQAEAVAIGPGAEFSNVPLEVIPQGMDPAWGIDGVIGFRMLRQLNPCLDTNGGRLLYKGE